MGQPRAQLSRHFKVARRASTAIVVNSVTWTNLDTGLDLIVPARVGDTIEVSANGIWDLQAVYGYLDVVTLVSAAPVTSFATQGTPSNSSQGVQSWRGLTGVLSLIGGSAWLPLTVGDIVGGSVTLRLRTRTDTATNKNFHTSADHPFQWCAKNLGPADGT